MHYQIKISCPEDKQETLIAELLSLEYESFWQDDDSIIAYIDEENFVENDLKGILSKHLDSSGKNYDISVLENKNWNEEWEKNFEYVTVDEEIIVRADFHKPYREYPYDIVINPKMSFGTGHHETTELMLRSMLAFPHKNKAVLDVGTGTGILSIMAHKLGATEIVATDIDEWSIENSKENFSNNSTENIQLFQGSIEEIDLNGKFDIIIANINRNVLLHEIPFYSKLLNPNGTLFLSGFYDTDIGTITVVCEKNGLNSKNCQLKNNWACLTFNK